MKKIVILMSLIATMAWGQDYKADITGLDSLLVIADSAAGKKGYIILDYIWENQRKNTLKITHNPDYEYFKVFEKCDTTWFEEYVLINPDPYFNIDALYVLVEPLYRKNRYVDKIDCHTDTVWADKIPVYLTPDEYELLMQWIKDLKDAEWLLKSEKDLEILQEMESLYQQVKERLK